MKSSFPIVAAALVFTFSLLSIAPAAQAEKSHAKSGEAILAETLTAHGGLERWQSFNHYHYRVNNFPLGANGPFTFDQTTDLRDRRHRSVGQNFIAGFDGQQAWATPNIDAIGISPRFYLSGNFYFAAMPFVFADEAATVRNLGDIEFDKQTYHRLGVSYTADAGDSAKDAYVVYIDTKTKRLRMIDFTVTYGAADPAKAPHKAMVFNDFAKANGLLVPESVSLYGWADGKLQGDAASYTLSHHKFDDEKPNDADFAVPENAVIDNPPAE